MSTDINSGPGWYEVIHPATATTEIVCVMEDGSIYCPEGVITRGEFLYASARGNAHRMIRAGEPSDAQVRAAVNAWHRTGGTGREDWYDNPINRERMRAALRAAGVVGQEGGSRG